MLKAMLFIDFENFEISTINYYKSMGKDAPKLNYNKLADTIKTYITIPVNIIKTFLFAPKPNDFLMSNLSRKNKYDWLKGMKNQNYFTIIEGRHVAKPNLGYTYKNMDINRPESYHVEEKGTDVNIATHLLTKAFHNAYDVAIILSGDTDYIPVIDILNTLGKTVIVIGVKGQNLNKFIQHTDAHFLLCDDFFQQCQR